MAALVIWGASAIATCAIAAAKNRNVVGWFFLGFFLGPIAVLLVILSPSLSSSYPAGGQPASGSLRGEFEALRRDFQALSRRLDDLGARIAAGGPQRQEAPPQPVAVEKPAAAAPSPQEFERAVTTKKAAAKADIETDLGKFWLNKIGIVIFSLGIAFLLTYSFARFGPVAKIGAGYLIAAALFLSGIKLEQRETYANYGKVLLAGAWAITYFTTYAMHHFDASRIIASQLVDLCLLAVVAAGIIAHSLRYKSEALTAMALLIGYLTSVVGDIGPFTLASAGILALITLAVVYKMGWVRLIFLGILLTYLTHGVWVIKQVAMIHVPFNRWTVHNVSFFFDMAFLSIYWALFSAAIHVVRDRDPDVEKKLAAANMANFLLFFLMAFPKYHLHYPGRTFNLIFGLGLVYMALATAMEIVRKKELSLCNALIAVSLLTLSLPLRFLPYETILIWLVELPFLVFAGFAFDRRVYRYLGFGLAILLLARILTEEQGGQAIRVFGAPSWDAVLRLLGFLASAACYAVYHVYAKKTKEPLPDAPLRNVYSGLAAAYLTLYAWVVVESRWMTPGLCLESLGLFIVGVLLCDRLLRTYALCVLGLVVARYCFWDRPGALTGLPLLFAVYGPIACAAAQYAMYRVLAGLSRLEKGEAWTGKLVFFTAVSLLVLAILDHVPVNWVTPEVGALGLCVLWWGARISEKPIRIFGLAVLIFGAVRFLFIDTYAGLTVWFKWTLIAANLACAYAAYFIYRDLNRHALLDADEGSLLAPLFYGSCLLLVWTILEHVEDTWVSVALGCAGVALFAGGFLIREKVFRHAGFILFGLTLGKVVFVDLAGLAIIYKIISFIVVGLLFLAVSFLYTRTAPAQQQK